MAIRIIVALNRVQVVARSENAAKVLDRGDAGPAATHDHTSVALGDGHQMLMALAKFGL